jgi:hypothetical protein
MLSSACDRSATVNNSKVGTAVVAVSAWVGNLFLLPPCFPTFLLFNKIGDLFKTEMGMREYNKNKKSVFCFVLFSLIRNFVGRKRRDDEKTILFNDDDGGAGCRCTEADRDESVAGRT